MYEATHPENSTDGVPLLRRPYPWSSPTSFQMAEEPGGGLPKKILVFRLIDEVEDMLSGTSASNQPGL